MGKPHRILEEAKDRAMKLYKSGLSIDQLSAVYAVDYKTMWRHLKSWGVILRAPVRQSKLAKKAEEITALYRSGYSFRQLAKRYRVDRNTVATFLIRHGIRRSIALRGRDFFITGEGKIGVLAGLIAGEGSILLVKGENRIRVVLCITNTDPDIIEFLSGLGGKYYWSAPRKDKRGIRGIKPVGTWRLSRACDVLDCLSLTLPYIFGKKRLLAKQGIELLKTQYGLRETRGPVNLPANQLDSLKVSRLSESA
jgi:transposase-like protein